MLRNILKFTGVEELKREKQKSINAGFGSEICIAGSACSFGSFGAVPLLPCMAGPDDAEFLRCINGVWVRV